MPGGEASEACTISAPANQSPHGVLLVGHRGVRTWLTLSNVADTLK